jgi:hypothetical protein
MKKLMLPIMTALLLFSFFSPSLIAASAATPISVPVNTPVESARAEVLLNRLDEINTVDKSELNGAEKRALRKEVRGIKHELKQQNQGVYLSIGAIIIIVLLLILLL